MSRGVLDGEVLVLVLVLVLTEELLAKGVLMESLLGVGGRRFGGGVSWFRKFKAEDGSRGRAVSHFLFFL